MVVNENRVSESAKNNFYVVLDEALSVQYSM